MPTRLLRRSSGLLLAESWVQRALRIRPNNIVGLWLLDEQAGAVAFDRGPRRNHGAITGTTLGQPGPIPGHTSQLFDGTSDYINIYSAALATHTDNELLTNGGFETAGGGGADVFGTWGETAAVGTTLIERVNDSVHGGSWACRITTGDTAVRLDNSAAVIAGQTYNLTFWTRGDGTNAGRYGVWNNTAGNAILATTTTGVTGTSYQQVTYTFTAPVGCASIAVFLWNPTAGIAYFDDVSVRSASGSGFSGSEGTLLCWAKVANAGVWADGAGRYVAGVHASGGSARIERTTTANQLRYTYTTSTTNHLIPITSLSGRVDWIPVAMTWSKSADQVKAYADGIQVGSTSTGLGVPTGSLTSNECNIGAYRTTPASVWSGYLGPTILYNYALSATEIAALSRVGG